jgi:DNA-binding transcriptional ArsR family regulator
MIIKIGQALNCLSRTQILALAKECGQLNISALAERMGFTLSTISYHVKILKESGLVVTRREGRKVFVSPVWKHISLVGERV